MAKDKVVVENETKEEEPKLSLENFISTTQKITARPGIGAAVRAYAKITAPELLTLRLSVSGWEEKLAKLL